MRTGSIPRERRVVNEAGRVGLSSGVRDFDELVNEAENADVGTWDFTWLDGRAIEDRPSWRYLDRVVERTAMVSTLLEVQAGAGTMLAALPHLPSVTVATEGYLPSVAVARPRLRDVGAHLVVTSQLRPGLPFEDRSFELVISRHPVAVWWDEIHRVLLPGGMYFAQHVGPHSLRTLTEFFVGPVSDISTRDVDAERRAAEAAGFTVREAKLERTRVAFFDVGAVVYFLRLVPWIVPGFSVPEHRERLRELHERIERDGAFETTSSRTLIEVHRPTE